jgi:glycosyltransferase involved in cell wall biosynthesis
MMAGAGTLAGRGIAHLIESDGPGGAERVVADLAKAFQTEGARSVVFLPAHGEGWLERQLDGSGAAIAHFHLDRPYSLACVRSLAAAFRRHDISVAHSHEFSLAVYGSLASRLAGVPHVITMHGGRYYANRLRRRAAMRAAIALSSRTVAVSSSVAAHLGLDLGIRRSRIATIPNGVRYVEPQRITLRDELRLSSADRLIVSVGNLYPVKGHRFLIEALALLGDWHPNVHLAISGRGALAEPLTELAQALGLGPRVHLIGLRSDVAAVLAASDLFALPSLSEGLPLALLEAMFSRRAIVASDVGEVGIALANGHAGLLVEPGNAASLARALHRLLSDDHLAGQLAERAQHRAAAEYDVSRMVQRYSETYLEVLQRSETKGRLERGSTVDEPHAL